MVHISFGGHRVGAAYLAVDAVLETAELRAVLCRNEGTDDGRHAPWSTPRWPDPPARWRPGQSERPGDRVHMAFAQALSP